jgi:probable phosphoglycerate mutase
MPRMRRLLFSLLLLSAFVCSDRILAVAEPLQMQAPPAPLAPVKTQATLIIVRHAEKAGPQGDVPLTDAGHARAAALAHVLRSANVSTIFVTDLQRTQQTAAPIAKALNLTPVIVPAADVAGLAAKLAALPAGSTALVVNHNPSVLRLATAFGAKDVAPMTETEYDRMMILSPGADGKAAFLTLRYGASTAAQ